MKKTRDRLFFLLIKCLLSDLISAPALVESSKTYVVPIQPPPPPPGGKHSHRGALHPLHGIGQRLSAAIPRHTLRRSAKGKPQTEGRKRCAPHDEITIRNLLSQTVLGLFMNNDFEMTCGVEDTPDCFSVWSFMLGQARLTKRGTLNESDWAFRFTAGCIL